MRSLLENCHAEEEDLWLFPSRFLETWAWPDLHRAKNATSDTYQKIDLSNCTIFTFLLLQHKQGVDTWLRGKSYWEDLEHWKWDACNDMWKILHSLFSHLFAHMNCQNKLKVIFRAICIRVDCELCQIQK